MSSNTCGIASGGDVLHAQVHGEEDRLVGSVLAVNFRVEKFLRHDNHADVYSILCLSSPSESFEARVYDLGGLSPKLRQYRLRNVKRLSNRTVWGARWGARTIIVYKAGSENQEDRGDREYKESLPVKLSPNEEPDVSVMDNTKTQQKTRTSDHQREITRIQQLERRQSKRRNKRQTKRLASSEGNPPTTDKTEVESPPQTADEEALYILLYIAHSDRPEFQEQLPLASRVALQHYLQNHDLAFEHDDELEAFIKAKTHEILFLQRQQKKLPEVLKRRHDNFEQILREQARHARHSKEYKELQQSVKIAQHRLKVARNVRDILPKVIEDADLVRRDLSWRLSLARKKKEQLETLRSVNTKLESLKRQVNVYERCSRAVVPGSGPYAQAVAQLAAAEKELQNFTTMHSKFLRETVSLETLQVEYKHLLGSAGKKPAASTRAPVHELTQQFENMGSLGDIFLTRED
jgi:hypothetical protein